MPSLQRSQLELDHDSKIDSVSLLDEAGPFTSQSCFTIFTRGFAALTIILCMAERASSAIPYCEKVEPSTVIQKLEGQVGFHDSDLKYRSHTAVYRQKCRWSLLDVKIDAVAPITSPKIVNPEATTIFTIVPTSDGSSGGSLL